MKEYFRRHSRDFTVNQLGKENFSFPNSMDYLCLHCEEIFIESFRDNVRDKAGKFYQEVYGSGNKPYFMDMSGERGKGTECLANRKSMRLIHELHLRSQLTALHLRFLVPPLQLWDIFKEDFEEIEWEWGERNIKK